MGFFRQEYWSGLPLPSPASKSRKPECTPGHTHKEVEKTDLHEEKIGPVLFLCLIYMKCPEEANSEANPWVSGYLMLGGIGGRRRRGRQRMKWLDAKSDSKDINLSKLRR